MFKQFVGSNFNVEPTKIRNSLNHATDQLEKILWVFENTPNLLLYD